MLHSKFDLSMSDAVLSPDDSENGLVWSMQAKYRMQQKPCSGRMQTVYLVME